jgi:hypothetical protein
VRQRASGGARLLLPDGVATHWAAYARGLANAGRPVSGENWRVVRCILVAPTDAEAERRVHHAEGGIRFYIDYIRQVLARAELSSGPIRRNLAGNVVPFPFGAQPFFMLQTTSPVPTPALAKTQPLLLVDMPLRFDRLAANNFAGYPLDPVNGASYSFAGPPAFNPAAYAAQAATGNMYVTLTYMVELNTTDATDAVGVLGVRLVPDNTP